MKLFRSPHHPDHWIGEDPHSEEILWIWPEKDGGWLGEERKPWTGGRRGLKTVDTALARGTGWPGGGRGRPRIGDSPAKTFGVRADEARIATWSKRAKDEGKKPSVWARDELDAAAARPPRPKKP